LIKVWQRAANENRLPTKAEREIAIKHANEMHWHLNAEEKTATHVSTSPLSFNAIAKGYIVEAACNAALQNEKGVRGLIINLGGDLRVCGDAVKTIAVADPTNAAENAPAIAKIFVNNMAVATSGNYRRGWQIGDKWYSHILDPRNGLPVENIVSATVIAKSSTTADALATICNVLPPHESIALVESQNAACLLIARDGQQFKSAGWEQFEQPQLFRFAAAVAEEDPKKNAEKKDEKKAASELLELEVKIELSRPAGAQYRRPYVAVWLEDADEFPVRTGLLFMMTKGNGSRWHRDLLRWYRQDNVRRLADDTKLIETTSSASRGPGEYRAVFDGLDDNGKPLKPGKYMLFVEVAREHGTYQIIRQPLELGTKPIETTQMKSNVEIKSASFEYRKPAEKAAQ
jgi:thiamine biosynthesis lipoprotein